MSRAGLGLPAIIGAIVLFVLGWMAVRALRTEPTPTPPPAAVVDEPSAISDDFDSADDSTDAAVDSPDRYAAESRPTTTSPTRIASSKPATTSSRARLGELAPAPLPASTPPSATSSSRATSSRVASAPTGSSNAEQSSAPYPSRAVHEEIPEVPVRASRTIRGTVRVSVRVIVNDDGTVFAALTDERGPSRYFERLALEAAKKWTFTPADASDQRVVLIRFAFSRDTTTANAFSVN
jgi:TonB family protein